MICDDKVAKRAIDEDLERGLTFVGLARLMTLRGFAVSAATVGHHNSHREPSVRSDAKVAKRDAAIIIRDKLLDAMDVAEGDENSRFHILAKDSQGAIANALKAQVVIDKRDNVKVQNNFWVNLYTGQQTERPVLLDDPSIFEGRATEIE